MGDSYGGGGGIYSGSGEIATVGVGGPMAGGGDNYSGGLGDSYSLRPAEAGGGRESTSEEAALEVWSYTLGRPSLL